MVSMKMIQPLSDPDDVRAEAAESTKETYAGYYVNQPSPDPLEWQSQTKIKEAQAKLREENRTPEDKAAELSRLNDPLKDQ